MVLALRPPVLPLVNGDRLTRAEFERRYHAMPGVKKAELINGVVYMPSPVSYGHATTHALLTTWISTYEIFTPGTLSMADGTVRIDEDNEPQPDVSLFREGGKAKVDPDGYVSGAPELLVEVAYSSRAYDLHQKKDVYRRSGVGTYIVVEVEEGELQWFELEGGRYVEREPDADRIYRSQHFPGLWLDAGALLDGDKRQFLATLHQGIASR